VVNPTTSKLKDEQTARRNGQQRFDVSRAAFIMSDAPTLSFGIIRGPFAGEDR
jgi:hypothetical protein